MGVIASKNPPAELRPKRPRISTPADKPSHQKQLYVLENDVVLALLEEHAKRVVENDAP